MSYRIVSIDSNGIRLRRNSELMIVPIVGTFLGSVILGIGTLSYIQLGAQPYAIAFILAGILFVSAPWVIISIVMRREASEIVFDNAGSRVCIIGSSRDEQDFASIPYEQLHSFVIRLAGTSNSTNTSYESYDVCVLLKDGPTLRLLSSISGREKAAAAVSVFERNVSLHAPLRQIAPPELPSRFIVETTHASTELRWQQPASLGIIAFVVLFFSVFFGLAYVFSKVGADDQVYVNGVRVIAGVGVLIFLTMVVGMFRSRGETQLLRIDDDKLRLAQISKSGKSHSEHVIALSEISHIGFAPIEMESANGLAIVTREAAAAYSELRQQDDHLDNWAENARLAWNSLLASIPLRFINLGNESVITMINISQRLNIELARRKKEDSLFSSSANPSVPHFLHRPALPADLISRLSTNRYLGVLNILAIFLPALSLVLALSLPKLSNLGSYAWLFHVINVVHIGLALLASWKLLRVLQMKVLGTILGGLALTYAYALVSMQPIFGFSSGMALFLLSVVQLVSGLRLLRIPEPEPLFEN